MLLRCLRCPWIVVDGKGGILTILHCLLHLPGHYIGWSKLWKRLELLGAPALITSRAGQGDPRYEASGGKADAILLPVLSMVSLNQLSYSGLGQSSYTAGGRTSGLTWARTWTKLFWLQNRLQLLRCFYDFTWHVNPGASLLTIILEQVNSLSLLFFHCTFCYCNILSCG